MTPPINDYIKKETSAQKWRRLTPVTVISNLVTNFVGFGMLAYFANYYIENEDKKFEILFRQLKDYKESESRDVLCLTKSVYQCCGEKANASC